MALAYCPALLAASAGTRCIQREEKTSAQQEQLTGLSRKPSSGVWCFVLLTFMHQFWSLIKTPYLRNSLYKSYSLLNCQLADCTKYTKMSLCAFSAFPHHHRPYHVWLRNIFFWNLMCSLKAGMKRMMAGPVWAQHSRRISQLSKCHSQLGSGHCHGEELQPPTG